MRKPAGATLLLTLLSLLFSATFVKAEGTSENMATTDSVPLIVRQITLIGNKKTRDGIVYRELNFAVGDTLHVGELKKRFERSENNLFNTQLFNSIDITWLQDQSDMRIFVILQERWYIFPIPIFEVAERNFNAWWKTKDFSRVVYGMALSWRNVTGRNDLLTGTLRLGYTQRMSLSYSLPFIDRQRKIGMSVSGFYLRNREIQIMAIDNELVNFKEENRYAKKEYGGNFGLTIRPGLYESHLLETAYRNCAVTDSAVLVNPDYLNNRDSSERYFSFRYLFKSNHLDISVYPTKGNYFDVEVTKSGFPLLQDDIDILSVTMRYKQFWQIGKRWFAAAGATGKLSGRTFQPYYNTRALGYNKEVIRGYDYYVIDGQHFALFKSGLRFSLLPKKDLHAGFIPSAKFNTIPFSIYVGIFADLGYVIDNQFEAKNPLTNSWQYGYGAGLDLFTYYDVVIRAEYSFNKLGESGFFLHFTAPI